MAYISVPVYKHPIAVAIDNERKRIIGSGLNIPPWQLLKPYHMTLIHIEDPTPAEEILIQKVTENVLKKYTSIHFSVDPVAEFGKGRIEDHSGKLMIKSAKTPTSPSIEALQVELNSELIKAIPTLQAKLSPIIAPHITIAQYRLDKTKPRFTEQDKSNINRIAAALANSSGSQSNMPFKEVEFINDKEKVSRYSLKATIAEGRKGKEKDKTRASAVKPKPAENLLSQVEAEFKLLEFLIKEQQKIQLYSTEVLPSLNRQHLINEQKIIFELQQTEKLIDAKIQSLLSVPQIKNLAALKELKENHLKRVAFYEEYSRSVNHQLMVLQKKHQSPASDKNTARAAERSLSITTSTPSKIAKSKKTSNLEPEHHHLEFMPTSVAPAAMGIGGMTAASPLQYVACHQRSVKILDYKIQKSDPLYEGVNYIESNTHPKDFTLNIDKEGSRSTIRHSYNAIQSIATITLDNPTDDSIRIMAQTHKHFTPPTLIMQPCVDPKMAMKVAEIFKDEGVQIQLHPDDEAAILSNTSKALKSRSE